MDTKQDHYVCYLQETHLKPMDTHRLKVKCWKVIFCRWRPKESKSNNTMSYKIDFGINTMKQDKEGHYIMIKDNKNQKKIIKIKEDITIINIYAPNIGAPQYIRQIITSMKGEINNNTIILGDFNNPLMPMDRSIRQKISKETQPLNDTMGQLDLIGIYRAYHPKTMNIIFFSSAH